MRYLHTMVRVRDLDESLAFYCGKLGLKEIHRKEVPAGRFTLVFVAPEGASGDITFEFHQSGEELRIEARSGARSSKATLPLQA